MKKILSLVAIILILSTCSQESNSVDNVVVLEAEPTNTNIVNTPIIIQTEKPKQAPTSTPFFPTDVPALKSNITIAPVQFMENDITSELSQDIGYIEKDGNAWVLFILKQDEKLFRLMEDFGTVFTMAWSPDQEKIFIETYVSQTGQHEYWLLDKENVTKTRIFERVFDRIDDFSWAPDGNNFTLLVEDNIYIGNINDFELKKIYQGEYIYDISWSPTSDLIAFNMGENSLEEHIYTIQSDGSNYKQLTTIDALETSMQWSPDGESIAFKRQIVSEGGWTIFVINKDGTGERQVAEINDSSNIKWSPDGKNIGYFYGVIDPFQSFDHLMYPCIANVANLDFICYGIGVDRVEGWSKDGSLLFVYADDDDLQGYWVIDLATNQANPIFKD